MGRFKKETKMDETNTIGNEKAAAGLGVGIGLGVVFGALFGILLDNLALGIGIGIAIGAGLGGSFAAVQSKSNAGNKDQQS